MNNWVKILAVTAVVVLLFGFFAESEAAKLKAVIVTGQSNPWHPWEVSSPVLKQILEQTGLFEVDMAISPPGDEGIKDFKPAFGKYDVVVLDYDNSGREGWSEEAKGAFAEYVKGGGGVVVYHGASNSFPKWEEYNKIIGLGAWGDRDERWGPMVRYREGKVVLDNTPGKAGSHGPAHAFEVVHRNTEHPITKGLPERWIHAKDELYAEMRGPAENLTILATAYSDPKKDGTGENEPMLFTIDYGKGRVFHTTLGHARDFPITAMECVGFITTFQRGAEWAATGKVTQKVPEDFPTATEVSRWKNYRPARSVDELLGEIAKYEYGQSRESLVELAEIVHASSGSASRMKELEKQFLGFLGSRATPAGKQFVCRQLSLIGSEESVPVLGGMLGEPATFEMALYALERIRGSSVDEALRSALAKTSGKERVGIINSLGVREDKESVGTLAGLIYEPDAETACAAASALGTIGGPEATAALGEAKDKTSGKVRGAVLDGYLRCADALAAQGERRGAVQIYRQLNRPVEPFAIRTAALRGIVEVMGERSARILLRTIKGNDEAMQSVAIGLVREVPGDGIIRAVTAEFGNLPVSGQVQLLSALADRGDAGALPAVVKAAGGGEETVRIAALKALGKVGDSSTVSFLAGAAAERSGAEREAARRSLYSLKGAEIDGNILAAVREAESKVEVELIRAVGQRHIGAGKGALLEGAQDADGEVRLESVKSLREIAGPEDMASLVEVLMNTKSEAELKEAEKTVASVGRQSGDASSVLGVIDFVSEVKIRGSLIGLLGAIGDSKSLPVLKAALKDKDADIRLAAIRALGDWPNATTASELRRVVGSGADEKEKVLALRGYIRLIGLESERSAAETVKMYRAAMKLASNVSEKKMVLSGLGDVEGAEALDMAASYLGDKELSQEAAAAVVRIGWKTFKSEPEKTRAAAKKVLEVSENKSIRAEAEELLEYID